MKRRRTRLNWEDLSAMPQAMACDLLEPVPAAPPFRRGRLRELGLPGLQIGGQGRMFRACLNLDLCRLSDRHGHSTEAGRVFRVNRRVYYMEQDATKKLPFAAASFEWVYAEHFIEHITQPQAIAWLKEVRRILEPGGLLRLTTPDLLRYAEGYLDPAAAFFKAHRAEMRKMGCPPMETRRAWMVNQIFRFWGHRWIYDLDELLHVVREAGFSARSFARCGFRKGSDREVCGLDLELRRAETIYVEVRRP